MSYFILILLRIVYWFSFAVAIASAFGYEDSVLNPSEEFGVGLAAFMAVLFAVIGGLALARNIKIHGWNRYEIFTIFTSVVASIGGTVIQPGWDYLLKEKIWGYKKLFFYEISVNLKMKSSKINDWYY